LRVTANLDLSERGGLQRDRGACSEDTHRVSDGAVNENLATLLQRFCLRGSDFHKLALAVVQLEHGVDSYYRDE
jgi:hypothetical protein